MFLTNKSNLTLSSNIVGLCVTVLQPMLLTVWSMCESVQWNSNQNIIVFIQENAVENAVFEMVSIVVSTQCVNKWINIFLYHHSCRMVMNYFIPVRINPDFPLPCLALRMRRAFPLVLECHMLFS